MSEAAYAAPMQVGALRARAPRAEDARALGAVLRRADVAEVRAASGLQPAEALERAFEVSDRAWSIEDASGGIVGAFGRARPPAGGGFSFRAAAPWLLAADGLVAHRRSFLRGARGWLPALEDGVDVLFNVIDARNAEHLRWIDWLGFTRIRLVRDYGVERRAFYEFAKLPTRSGRRRKEEV